ncbi:MAG: site-2 protease family protein [Clostridium sp.]|nr:site-2 protease family protein [Clostridium sp.]
MLGRLNLINILYSLPAVFVAFSFHEYAHALIAYGMGDPTPKNQGRLTLSPLAHVDWIGFIMFAIFGFGWAKPVQYNPTNFKNRKIGNILVSLAGPMANLVVAFLALIIINIVGYNFSYAFYGNPNNTIVVVFTIFERIASLNIVFAFLNLIPVPPFDGYKVVKAIFSRRNIKFFWTLERYSMIILFAMIFLNIFSYIIRFPYDFTYRYLNNIASWITGIFM